MMDARILASGSICQKCGAPPESMDENGTAINGPHACTCDVPESRLEEAERRRDEAERQVIRLREARERRLDHQQSNWWQIKRLRDRIRELENQLDAKST